MIDLETMEVDDLQHDHAPFIPSPAEIAAGCAAIRAEWSAAEEMSRRVTRNPSPETRWVRSAASEE